MPNSSEPRDEPHEPVQERGPRLRRAAEPVEAFPGAAAGRASACGRRRARGRFAGGRGRRGRRRWLRVRCDSRRRRGRTPVVVEVGARRARLRPAVACSASASSGTSCGAPCRRRIDEDADADQHERAPNSWAVGMSPMRQLPIRRNSMRKRTPPIQMSMIAARSPTRSHGRGRGTAR